MQEEILKRKKYLLQSVEEDHIFDFVKLIQLISPMDQN